MRRVYDRGSVGKCTDRRKRTTWPRWTSGVQMATNRTPDNWWSVVGRGIPVAGASWKLARSAGASRSRRMGSVASRARSGAARTAGITHRAARSGRPSRPLGSAGSHRARGRRAGAGRGAAPGHRPAPGGGPPDGAARRATPRRAGSRGPRPERVEELLDFLEGPADGAYLLVRDADGLASERSAGRAPGAPAAERLRRRPPRAAGRCARFARGAFAT